MKLNEYIQTFPRTKRTGVIKKIAAHLGLTVSTVRSMICGIRKIDPKYAIPLEEITNGQVHCHETCPTVYPKPYKWR